MGGSRPRERAGLFDRDETIRINARQEIGNGGRRRASPEESTVGYDLRSGTRDRPSLRFCVVEVNVERGWPRTYVRTIVSALAGRDRAATGICTVALGRYIPVRPNRIGWTKIRVQVHTRSDGRRAQSGTIWAI